MKIITLNTWGGRLHDSFIAFLENYNDTDIFCFQEVYDNAHGKDTIWKGANFESLDLIKDTLKNHVVTYHPHLGDWWGLACATKKEINIISQGEHFVHKEKGWCIEEECKGFTAKNIQYVTFSYRETLLTVINFHGLWNGKGKDDTEERIMQSQKIIDFIKTLKGEVVLCGDFNLNPHTESITMLEDFGLVNLVKQYGITSTRTSYYAKEGKFADYIFVSKGVSVKDFQVLPEEVSDHAPLFLEIL